jgi:hypothetical protein
MRKIATQTLTTTTILGADDLVVIAGGGAGHSTPKDPKSHGSSQGSSSYDRAASRDPWMKSAGTPMTTREYVKPLQKQRGMTADQFFNTGAPRYRYY